MKRYSILLAIVWLAIVIAVPRGDAGAVQKGKGGKKNDPNQVVRLTLHDDHPLVFDTAPGGLFSDRMVRNGSDDLVDGGDNDGYLELADLGDTFADILSAPDVIYQDRRIDAGGDGNPDPCSTLDVTSSGSNEGRMWAYIGRGTGDWNNDCPLYEEGNGKQPFLNDARTVSLEFDKAEAGGSCACAAFSSRLAAISTPSTGFEDNPVDPGEDGMLDTPDDIVRNSCILTVATEEIVTDSLDDRTGNTRIVAYSPYLEEARKGKKGAPPPAPHPFVRVSIKFDIDHLPGEPNHWELNSAGYYDGDTIIPVVHVDGDTKVIKSTIEPFYLGFGSNEVCPDLTMPFKMTLERFEVPAG